MLYYLTVYYLIVSPKLVGFQADIPPLMAVCLFWLKYHRD
ncbi:hypothetical protein AO372_0017 [Moraxella catarrhalis]|nr:hypothetical protein AO372_0017 [Moraxella catarrhalis]